MFKNFDKVFKFTFINQVRPNGYKILTIVIALFLLLTPTAILVIIDKMNSDEDIKSCNADRIYVINEAAPDVDYGALNMTNVSGYTAINYVRSDSVEDALNTIKEKGEKKSLILEIAVTDDSVDSRIILPDDSEIEKDDAENLNDFLNKNSNIIAIMSSGVKMQDLTAISQVTNYDIYKTSGYDKGESIYDDKSALNDQINSQYKPAFALIITFISIMIIYFIALYYGNGIMQNIVLEKSSKLMDTMLISVRPEAMIFGKMLATISAALLQFMTWVVSLIVGVVAALKVINVMHPETEFPVLTFIKSFKEMGIFKPLNVVIGILVLVFGIIFYSSISAICGSISSTKEEAASNQGLFIIILIISFYFVLFGGMKSEVATWMYLVPSTGAMVLPAGVCMGTSSMLVSVAGLLIMIISTILLVILAGKLYTMMALYKGNKVNLSKALKMLAGK
ncbi:MAG TPA: hypothetical protein DEO83_05290 [Lachnospiraceae bacterium]|nr:hypothetical protein [Lachnospiraceae bacterium]